MGKPEFKEALNVFSDSLSPDQMNALIRMECDKGLPKGDIVRPHAIVHQKWNIGVVHSRISKYDPLEEHIK